MYGIQFMTCSDYVGMVINYKNFRNVEIKSSPQRTYKESCANNI